MQIEMITERINAIIIFHSSALKINDKRINGTIHAKNVDNNTTIVVTAAFFNKCFAFWK